MTSSDLLKEPLLEAHKAFHEGKISEAEAILLKLPQDHLKVKHNLAVVQYSLDKLDSDAAVAVLEEGIETYIPTEHDGSNSGPSASPTSGGDGSLFSSASLLLKYTGQENAVLNLATILARTGHPARATEVLRQLLRTGLVSNGAKSSPIVDFMVLAKSVVLFHTLTTSMQDTRQRSEEDEGLEHSVMLRIIENDTNPESVEAKEVMLRLFSYITDSTALVNAMKEEADAVKLSMLLNNLGAFSLKEKKPYIANLCFQKAESVIRSSVVEKTADDSAIPSGSPVLLLHPVIYNAGVCALLREDFETAIAHFFAVQKYMKSSPLFWVRLGEAALGALHALQRKEQQEEYAHRQATFSQLLHSGHLYENFQYLLLPNASIIPGQEASAQLGAGKEGSAANSVSSEINLTLASGQRSPVAIEMEALATSALQNALSLLVREGHSYATAFEMFPDQRTELSYAMLYWVALEVYRKNYAAALSVGLSLLELCEKQVPSPNLHATLLAYVVEALVHLNDPKKAMDTLKHCRPFHLMYSSGGGSVGSRTTTNASTSASGAPGGVGGTDPCDVAQRSRVEVLLIQVVITQILSGQWGQAASTMEVLMAKIFDSAPAGSTEFQPEADALFSYQLLAIFLELAQGKQGEAAALLSKLHWSV